MKCKCKHQLYIPRAQHINFGRSHPPRKIIPKCPFGIPRMNFPEFPGSAFFLAFLYYLIGNAEFPGIFRHFPGEGFWGPQIAFSGEDGVDVLGSGELYSLAVTFGGSESLAVAARPRTRTMLYIQQLPCQQESLLRWLGPSSVATPLAWYKCQLFRIN